MPLFSPLSGNLWDTRFEVRAPKTVTVPAGTFDVLPVAILKNGSHGVSNIFYLTTALPRRIVKADVLEQNMTIELIH